MSAKFQIERNLKGDYHFLLVSPNGRTLATSECYKSKSGVVGAIKAMRANVPKAEVEDHSTKEWLARQAAEKPAAKAARAIGKAMGKARNVLEDALTEPAPTPPARTRSPAGRASR
jgi:uncharacterized protein YegP (UPF0339 family)